MVANQGGKLSKALTPKKSCAILILLEGMVSTHETTRVGSRAMYFHWRYFVCVCVRCLVGSDPSAPHWHSVTDT